ncbi:MAG TPA: hypothetical protein VG650_05020 [Mycobacteriales bacterium]|nr:hypothetical protein [Mycobacteriales bacterium]HWC34171.1 hypothetical protein [Mycobacteriales bacterium]
MIGRRRLSGAILISVGAVVLAVVEPAVNASPAHQKVLRIEPGTAAATASVFGITPSVSGLQLSATMGESTAAYQHTETQAKSGTVDLGSLGLVLATSQFCGRPELAEKDQPQPLTADSEDGEQHLTHGMKGLGEEAVDVAPHPESAAATTTTIEQKLPGVVAVRGRSRAVVRYVDGAEQVATSSVTETVSLLGGEVRFDGMSWTARRTSGVTSTRKTTFSFGKVTVGGVPLRAPDSAPDATISAVNAVLAPAGLSMRKPARTTNHHTGAVAIGPFTLRFSGSAIERTLIRPANNDVVTLENLLKQAGEQGDNCAQVRQLIDNLDNNLGTLAHVVLAIAAGAGSLDLQFGGVAAGAQDPVTYVDPFGSGGALPPGVSAAISPPPAGRHVPTVKPASATSATGSDVSEPVVASAAVHCVTKSPSTAHGCWHGLATVASAGALGVGIALLVADVAITRRRRVSIRGSVATSE